jgi:magnesium-transporting ATPase (P-type)
MNINKNEEGDEAMRTHATSDDDRPRSESEAPNAHGLSRRNLLLSGTTLAAGSALASVAPVRTAQAQRSRGRRGSGRTSW